MQTNSSVNTVFVLFGKLQTVTKTLAHQWMFLLNDYFYISKEDGN